MIEKVTLQLTGDSKLVPENGPDCGEMNPKTLLLYAAAKCSGMSRAATLTHEKYCGIMRMFRMIAPVSHEIAVVSTEPAKA